MAYTPPAIKSHSTPSNFAGLVVDGNRVAMTGATGNIFQTIDATGTPVTSPTAVNTATTLVVPQGAVSVTIRSTTNDVKVSEDSTMTAYFLVPHDTLMTFDVARQQNVYLATSGSTSVNFVFTIV